MIFIGVCMIDINLIRKNPEIVRDNIKKKFQDHKLPLVDEVISLDTQVRDMRTECDNLRASRNAISNEIGALKQMLESNKWLKLTLALPTLKQRLLSWAFN